eukprot:gene15916-18920_t
MFRLTTQGQNGLYQADYGKEIFEFDDCRQSLNFNYPINLMLPCIKALAVANRTRMTMNAHGLLHFEHQITSLDKTAYLVDFYVVAQLLDDNEMHMG